MCIQSHRWATRGERGDLPCSFWNRKSCLHFGKKGPDRVYLWIKLSIQNVVLSASRRKISECFPAGTPSFVFLTKCLSKCPSSTNILIHAYWDITKGCSGLFKHMQHPVYNPHIFATLLYSEPWHLELVACLKPCEALTRRKI